MAYYLVLARPGGQAIRRTPRDDYAEILNFLTWSDDFRRQGDAQEAGRCIKCAFEDYRVWETVCEKNPDLLEDEDLKWVGLMAVTIRERLPNIRF